MSPSFFIQTNSAITKKNAQMYKNNSIIQVVHNELNNANTNRNIIHMYVYIHRFSEVLILIHYRLYENKSKSYISFSNEERGEANNEIGKLFQSLQIC